MAIPEEQSLLAPWVIYRPEVSNSYKMGGLVVTGKALYPKLPDGESNRPWED
jgi:hypothetical protein